MAPSTSYPPPPPLDSPDLKDPLECPPLRWGILGCGRVSHDFVQALKLVPTASVVACAARDLSRAQAFATKHAVASAYGDYDKLLRDTSVDIVYVGNVHAFRLKDGEQCLKAGKHVLLEKPFACNTEDTKYLIELAASKQLFLQEGMWTRFFPAVERARQLVEQGALGEIVSVQSDFQFNASDSEKYPDSFVYQRKLGGGANFLVGPYPVAAALMFFDGRIPDSIKAVGQVDAATEVDLQAAVSLQFPPTDTDPSRGRDGTTAKLPGAGVATLSYGMLGESEEVTTVVGSKGRLTIQSPCHCPTKLLVQHKKKGRGNVEVTEYEYPLPDDTDDIVAAGGYFYPNSAGFCYEAAAVARCIAKGKTCCPQFTLCETKVVHMILEETRKQMGLKGVNDVEE